MNVLAYTLVAALWMVLIWFVSVLFVLKWQKLAYRPSFWLIMIGVGVLAPICAQVYNIYELTPALVLDIPFETAAIDTIKQKYGHGSENIVKFIFGLYGVGVFLAICRIVLSWRKLSQQTRRAPFFQYQTPVSKIDVIFTDIDIPPCSFGVFRPVILMPSVLKDELTQQQRNLIYAHEAAHIVARDPIVMLGLLIIRALYWPHMCMHDLFNRWQLATELRADTIALSGTPEFLRKTYGQTLVNVLRKNSRGALPCPSASLNLSNYRSAKMRVTNIMNPNTNTGKTKHYRKILGMSSGALFFAGVLGISALANETVSADRDAQPLQRVAPVMPKDCFINPGKYAAKVKLKFDVTKDGLVEHVRITDSDNTCFNKVSISTIKKWKYASNTRKFKNVETMIAYIVTE